MRKAHSPPPQIFVFVDNDGQNHISYSAEDNHKKMQQLGVKTYQRYEPAFMPDRLKHLSEIACWIRTTNGWTISIGTDHSPAIASVAAWPTKQDESPGMWTNWFTFKSSSISVRCFDAQDIRDAIDEVTNAPPP